MDSKRIYVVFSACLCCYLRLGFRHFKNSKSPLDSVLVAHSWLLWHCLTSVPHTWLHMDCIFNNSYSQCLKDEHCPYDATVFHFSLVSAATDYQRQFNSICCVHSHDKPSTLLLFHSTFLLIIFCILAMTLLLNLLNGWHTSDMSPVCCCHSDHPSFLGCVQSPCRTLMISFVVCVCLCQPCPTAVLFPVIHHELPVIKSCDMPQGLGQDSV